MLQVGADLVFEFAAREDGFAAAAGSCRVAALDHEVGDDAVEGGVVVVGAGAEGGEVLAGFGGVGCVEFEDYGAHGCFKEDILGHFGSDRGGCLGGEEARSQSYDMTIMVALESEDLRFGFTYGLALVPKCK